MTLGKSRDLPKLHVHLLPNGAIHSSRFISSEALKTFSTGPGIQEVLSKCSPLSLVSLLLLLCSSSKAAGGRASWNRIIKDSTPQVLPRSYFFSRNLSANTPSEPPTLFPGLTVGGNGVKDTRCGHYRGLFQVSCHFSEGDGDRKRAIRTESRAPASALLLYP